MKKTLSNLTSPIRYLGATLVALAFVSAPAFAGLSVSSQMYSGLNQFDDNDTEYLNVDADSDGQLDVGDTLAGWFNINEIFELNEDGTKTGQSNDIGVEFGGTTFVNELTGYFEVEVTSANCASEADGTTPCDGTVEDDDIYLFTFGPTASFTDGLDGTAGTADDLPTGAMYALYEDTSVDYDDSNISTAQDGTLVLVFGFDGLDLDEQQVALAPLAPSNISAGSGEGNFNIQASILYENLPGITLIEDSVDTGCGATVNPCIPPPGNDLIDVNASGGLEGGVAVTNPAGVTDALASDVQFVVRAEIPEPSPLALLGLGLLGLAFSSKKVRLAR